MDVGMVQLLQIGTAIGTDRNHGWRILRHLRHRHRCLVCIQRRLRYRCLDS